MYQMVHPLFYGLLASLYVYDNPQKSDKTFGDYC